MAEVNAQSNAGGPMDRPCSSARCDRPASCGGLMCESHWSQLPPRLRQIVLEAWLAFTRHGSGDGRWVAYDTVCRAATGYFATARPLSEVSRSAIFPVGRVRADDGHES